MEHYTILGRIGEGAHGIVLKAKHIEVINKSHKANTDVTICLSRVKDQKVVIFKNSKMSLYDEAPLWYIYWHFWKALR